MKAFLRKENTPLLLPPLEDNNWLGEENEFSDEVLIDLERVRTILVEGGLVPNQLISPHHSPPLFGRRMSQRLSYVSVASVDLTLLESSVIEEDLCDSKTKRVLVKEIKEGFTSNSEQWKTDNEEREDIIKEMFRSANFKDLCDMTLATKQSKKLYTDIDDIFKNKPSDICLDESPIYEECFPDLFLFQ